MYKNDFFSSFTILSILSKKGQQINNNKYFNYYNITEIICL